MKFEEIKGNLDKNHEQSSHKAIYLTNKYFNKQEFLDAVIRFDKNLKNDDLNIFNKCIKKIQENTFFLSDQEKFFLVNNLNNLEIITNYLIYRYKFKFLPKDQFLSEFPIHVCIEPTSICNLRCTMCFQMDQDFTGDRVKKNSNSKMMGKMNFELFKKIIDECSTEGTKAISIGSRGEPMINKDFGKMLKYVSKKKSFFDIKINTNATALTEKNCYDILESDVNVLVYSADGSDRETYEKIRVGAKFNEVVKNIERFETIRKSKFPNKNIETRISGVYLEDGTQNIEHFKTFWSSRVDNVVYVKMQKRWDTYNNVPDQISKPCDFLWEKLYIWWDGKVNPCDEDYKSNLSPGSIMNSTIKEIWNSKELNNLRNAHINGNRANYLPCDRCGV